MIASSGRLNLNSNSETIDGLSGVAGAAVALGAGTLTVGANNEASATFAGVISGTTGSFVKTGTGTQTLTGANTYTGTTSITTNGGILELANDSSTTAGRIGSAARITVNTGGTLLLSGSGTGDRINNAAPVTLANGGTIKLDGVSKVLPLP